MPHINQIQLAKILEFLRENPAMFDNVMNNNEHWAQLTVTLNELGAEGAERTTNQWKKVNMTMIVILINIPTYLLFNVPINCDNYYKLRIIFNCRHSIIAVKTLKSCWQEIMRK